VKIFSDLDLNGSTPVRVQPRLGEWGPIDVPVRSRKARMRIWVSLALLAGLVLLVALGTYMYHALQG
jgi:hypothetical protein